MTAPRCACVRCALDRCVARGRNILRRAAQITRCGTPWLALLPLVSIACTDQGTPWTARSQTVVDEHKITGGRARDLPHVSVPMVLAEGVPVERDKLPTITPAPGVTATLGWGRGALVERVDMQANASSPSQTLHEELFVIVQEGTATIDVGGKTAELTKDRAIYLQPGAVRSMKAGVKGLRAFEIYSPVRLDHLAMAGQSTAGANAAFPDQGGTPSLQPGVVVDLNELQWTPLTDPVPGKLYHRSLAYSRLLWGRNAQISLVRIDPKSEIAVHSHPEDQLTMTLRGTFERGVMDRTYAEAGAAGQMLFLPGGMVHSGKAGEVGVDRLDVFWPVRQDYVERAKQQQALYEQVIAPGERPRKLADGFTFTEGATWLKGKLYFSDMWFRNAAAGDYTGSPARSRLVALDPDGKHRVVTSGMQSNGTIAAPDGNLIVCDMFGHRIVEVNPASGRVVRVVLERVNGAPIDGPNDLVMDAKGGIYVTDPQFTPDEKKAQPGKQVYYIAPDGTARVVIGAGQYAMPNGVEISPDGRTLYVNNTWQQPGENFIWAYDIADDGSLSGKRQFAVVNLKPEVLEARNPADRLDSGADGSAVDTDGRYYVATRTGVQIFQRDGTYVGTIWMPQYPVSLTFGGPNNDVLYMVGESSVWSLQTKVHGFRHPSGMN